MVRQYHQPPRWYRAAHFFCRDFFPFRKCQFPIAFPTGLMCVLFLTGCDSGSTIDSVMSNGGTAVAPSSPTSPTVAPTPNPGLASPSGPSTETIGSSNNLRDTSSNNVGDISTRIDPPKISRQDFVIRVSLSAREQLLEQTKKPGNSYLLVGKVTPTSDDWQHISFVDLYDPDRQYQFRTNGVKILVPRELVNRLHNATIDLEPNSKEYFVTLAR